MTSESGLHSVYILVRKMMIETPGYNQRIVRQGKRFACRNEIETRSEVIDGWGGGAVQGPRIAR
jgi:hypothetical protein